MTHTTPRNRIAAFLALAVAVGAVAVPTASAVPIDPSAGGLVHSPDVQKVPPRTKRVTKRSHIQFGGVMGPLDSHKVPPRTAKKQPLEKRGGR